VDQSPTRNILITTPKRWDEACFLVPLVRAMAGSGLGVGVLCDEAHQAFWRFLPDLEILAAPLKPKAQDLATLLKGEWKIALLWEKGWQADAVMRAGIATRVGPKDADLRGHLTDTVAPGDNPLAHRVDRFLGVGEQLGIDVRRAEWFAPLAPGVGNRAKSILLTPESDFGPSHEWPAERWIELTQALVAEGHELVVAGYVSGNGMAQHVAQRSDAELLAVGDLAESLPQLAGFPILVAADGSLPHLAALAGSTCVTLFGPNDAGWRRPLGTRHIVVRKAVECAPCRLARCPLDFRCQRELELDSVMQAVRLVLQREI
jgi:ADP-heptose:LPS heptosyltransferase